MLWCSLLDFNQRGISPPGYKAGAIERTMRSEQNFIYKTTQSRQPLERRGNVAVGEWFCRRPITKPLQPVLGTRGARRDEILLLRSTFCYLSYPLNLDNNFAV